MSSPFNIKDIVPPVLKEIHFQDGAKDIEIISDSEACGVFINFTWKTNKKISAVTIHTKRGLYNVSAFTIDKNSKIIRIDLDRTAVEQTFKKNIEFEFEQCDNMNNGYKTIIDFDVSVSQRQEKDFELMKPEKPGNIIIRPQP